MGGFLDFSDFKVQWNSPVLRSIFITDLVLGVAMVIVGILKFKECPLNNIIPIILIIVGSVVSVLRLLNCFRMKLLEYFNIRFLELILIVAHLIVVIAGSYFVFREFKPNYDPLDNFYCDKTAYLLIFIYLVVIDIIFFVLIGGVCIVMLFTLYMCTM